MKSGTCEAVFAGRLAKDANQVPLPLAGRG